MHGWLFDALPDVQLQTRIIRQVLRAGVRLFLSSFCVLLFACSPVCAWTDKWPTFSPLMPDVALQSSRIQSTAIQLLVCTQFISKPLSLSK
jgi:hypothetical protein